jgi:hypothetical protein
VANAVPCQRLAELVERRRVRCRACLRDQVAEAVHIDGQPVDGEPVAALHAEQPHLSGQ